MRYGVFSDVHSNREALEAVLEALSRDRVDRLLCAGDLVGYGADPVPCLQRIRREGVASVCGNHDWAVVEKLSLDWFDKPAREALEWTLRLLPPEERSFLSDLPLVWEDGCVTVAHGSLREPERFHYLDGLSEAGACLRLQKTSIAFVGHTHLPGIFLEEGGRVRFVRADRCSLEPGRRCLVNVGAVGQPRDGDPRAAYCLYDSRAREVEIRRVPYPVEQAQEQIRKTGLPEFLAVRLSHGY